MVAWPGSADSAPLHKVVLGKTSSSPDPACPAKSRMIGGRTIVVKECQAVGKATIFQSLAGKSVKPYQVPFAGKIVSWSITLSRPSPKERKFFNDFYGSPSEARIAVLRKVKKRKTLRSTSWSARARWSSSTAISARPRPSRSTTR